MVSIKIPYMLNRFRAYVCTCEKDISQIQMGLIFLGEKCEKKQFLCYTKSHQFFFFWNESALYPTASLVIFFNSNSILRVSSVLQVPSATVYMYIFSLNQQNLANFNFFVHPCNFCSNWARTKILTDSESPWKIR